MMKKRIAEKARRCSYTWDGGPDAVECNRHFENAKDGSKQEKHLETANQRIKKEIHLHNNGTTIQNTPSRDALAALSNVLGCQRRIIADINMDYAVT